MDEQKGNIRPTKKQHELLLFIDAFIKEHGYSPSYREIMVGCNYTSVATVALHVNSLIRRGHLRKRDHSARSLEVAMPLDQPYRDREKKIISNEVKPGEEKWLIEKIDYFFRQAEVETAARQDQIEQLAVLLAALRILGLDPAAQSFAERFAKLKSNLPKG